MLSETLSAPGNGGSIELRRGPNDGQKPTRRETTMKLRTITIVSVDGVVQELGGGRTRTAAVDSSAADGSRRCSTTRP